MIGANGNTGTRIVKMLQASHSQSPVATITHRWALSKPTSAPEHTMPANNAALLYPCVLLRSETPFCQTALHAAVFLPRSPTHLTKLAQESANCLPILWTL